MPPLSEVTRALLDRPLVAIVSTAGKAPHAVPVWFRARPAEDGAVTFTIWSDRSRHWIGRIQRDPTIQIVVAESQPPFAGIVASGAARLLHDGVLEEAARICERYLGADETPAYIERWGSLDTIVEVTVDPSKLRAWDRGY